MINWAEKLSKESFPNKPKELKIIQTHISYVFIADELVYKIKKPVNFDFLDFTTLELRKLYCHREVELNRRLCPEIYLDVVAISQTEKGYIVENSENIVEYAVKMKRLPDLTMTELLKEKTVTKNHIDLIVDALVPFYKSARTGIGIDEYGSIDVISFNTEENFSQTRAFVGKALNRWRYDEIVKWTRQFIKNNATVFIDRIKKGYIRECHGDLYSQNINFDDLKKVYIYDCIEFNERFRCQDVASDIAFLSMDMDFHDCQELSDYFVKSYIENSGDKDLLKLLNFYKCYRAYVRGKIGCFTSEDKALNNEQRADALKTARKYFDLAYLYAGGAPKLFVVFGLPGTGKSTLARKLSEITLADWIASDIVRKSLVGIAPTEHRYESFEKGIYSKDYTDKTYRKMIELGISKLKKGRDVIVDATFRERKYRQLLQEVATQSLQDFDTNSLRRSEGVETISPPIYWIWCTTDDSVVRERFMKRKESEDISDARWEIYLAQKEKFEPPTEISEQRLIKLDTAQEVEKLMNNIIKRVYGS